MVKVEEAVTTSTAPTSESEIDTAAQAVATAHAASALAETQAAEAELDAAARVRKIKDEMDTKWQTMASEMSGMKTTLEAVSAQVQSLTSATTQTAEKVEEVATLAAAVVLTGTDISPTGDQENGSQDKPADKSNSERPRGKRLLRI